jgi:hypothetical protein
MRIRTSLLAAALTVGCATAVVTVATAPAGAAGATPIFTGWTGGTQVTLANGTVTSGLTAAIGVDCTNKVGTTASNTAASVAVPNVISSGAVQTSVASSAVTGGVQILSHARTAGVSVLNGLIKADAVDTTAVARRVNGVVSTTTSTTFANLKIVGVTLPLTIRKNFNVTIPGVAQIALNVSFAQTAADGTTLTQGIAIRVSLLKAAGNSPLGSSIYVNPTVSQVGPPVLLPVKGIGYATKISATATSLLQITAGMSAVTTVPCAGTGGVDKTNSTAGVNVPSLVTAGAASSTANGSATATTASAKESVSIAAVNLFGGLIKADALKGVAQVTKSGANASVVTKSTTLLNLVIAGKVIPVNVSPNTVITVANLGTVTINQQIQTASSVTVRLLVIKLSVAAYGLPIGAEVQVGVAYANVIV